MTERGISFFQPGEQIIPDNTFPDRTHFWSKKVLAGDCGVASLFGERVSEDQTWGGRGLLISVADPRPERADITELLADVRSAYELTIVLEQPLEGAIIKCTADVLQYTGRFIRFESYSQKEDSDSLKCYFDRWRTQVDGQDYALFVGEIDPALLNKFSFYFSLAEPIKSQLGQDYE